MNLRAFGWILGSSVYIDDMQATTGQVWKASITGLSIALVMALLVVMISRHCPASTGPIDAMANIASGESDLTRSTISRVMTKSRSSRPLRRLHHKMVGSFANC
ncbi:hypothetical protein ACVBEG_27735 [Pseudomonas sp. GG8]